MKIYSNYGVMMRTSHLNLWIPGSVKKQLKFLISGYFGCYKYDLGNFDTIVAEVSKVLGTFAIEARMAEH